jgi:hypothetical protein
MTQLSAMLEWFRLHGDRATLDQILRSGERWSYEFRARLVDAKRKGYFHTCEKGKTPGENIYRLVPPDGNQMKMAI